jgi:hypothetical protein
MSIILTDEDLIGSPFEDKYKKAKRLERENAALRALLIEGVPHMRSGSCELDDFQGTTCACCYATLESDHEFLWPIQPHHPDCWVSKVSAAVGISIEEIEKTPLVRPPFEGEVE